MVSFFTPSWAWQLTLGCKSLRILTGMRAGFRFHYNSMEPQGPERISFTRAGLHYLRIEVRSFKYFSFIDSSNKYLLSANNIPELYRYCFIYWVNVYTISAMYLLKLKLFRVQEEQRYDVCPEKQIQSRGKWKNTRQLVKFEDEELLGEVINIYWSWIRQQKANWILSIVCTL